MKKVIEISEVENGYIVHAVAVDDLTKQAVENKHYVLTTKEEVVTWVKENLK